MFRSLILVAALSVAASAPAAVVVQSPVVVHQTFCQTYFFVCHPFHYGRHFFDLD